MEEFTRLGNLCRKLSEFRSSGSLCDVEFTVGGKQFLAHKVVLSACSEYFQTMFMGSLAERKQSSVQLYEINPDIFERLLQFSYGSNLDINSNNAEDIIITADMLQFTEAVQLCIAFMKNQLDCSNCIGIYCFAKQHAFKDLQKTAWAFILSHFYQIVLEEEFLSTPYDVLDLLVKSEHIAIGTEGDVMHCVIRWLMHDVRERRKFCVSLVKNVRSNLIPKENIDKMLTSISDLCLKIAVKILTQDGPLTKVTASSKNLDLRKIWEPRQSAKKSFYAIGGCVPKTSRRYTWEDNDMDVVSYIERFDSFSKAWDPYPISLREARTNLAVVTVNGKIFAIGGEKDSMIYGTMECYDTLLKQWKWDLPSLNTPRCSCQTVATDKCIYILGGYVGSGAGKSIECYNIETNVCEVLNFSMQTERHSFGSVCVDNVIYMAGGVGLSECELRSVECYDLDRHEWWFARDMSFKRAFFTAVCLDNTIYAIGGYNENQGTLKSVEAYDMYKNWWQPCAPMAQARAGAFVAVMDKKIMVVGGKCKVRGHEGEMSWKVLHDAEIYDPVGNAWTSFGSMTFDPRCDGAAVVI